MAVPGDRSEEAEIQGASLNSGNRELQYLDEILKVLKSCCIKNGDKSYKESKDKGTPSGPSAWDKFQADANAPRQVVKDSTPVDITGMAPKTLDNLADAVGRGFEAATPSMKDLKEGSWLDGLLGTIGVPLLALAAGMTALFTAANIDWDGMEGTVDAIGKYGLMGGLKVFLAPFAKMAGKTFLKRIPVIGGIVSFYFAYEDFKNKEWTGMALNLLSGLLNLVGTFIAPGLANGLAIGVDILNAYLDTQTQGMDGEVKAEAKKDLLFEMAAGVWEKIKPYADYIPVIGSLFLFQKTKEAWDNDDIPNTLLFAARGLVNLKPGAGTILNLGLGIVQSFMDPSQRKDDKVGGIAVDFLKQFSEPFEKYISKYIRMVPFIGSLWYVGDFIQHWRDGKYGLAVADLGMAFIGLVPGWNMLNPVIGFFRGMFDEEYANKSADGQLGAATFDWIDEVATAMKDWVVGMLFSLVDMLPDFLGWGVEEFLGMMGMTRNSGTKREKPVYHVDKQGNTRKQFTQAQIEELDEDILKSLRDRGDISTKEREMIDDELDYWLWRADGGPVPKGQPTIVGERGPEAIIPMQDSYVLNNTQTNESLNDMQDSYAANNTQTNESLNDMQSSNEIHDKSFKEMIDLLAQNNVILNRLSEEIVIAVKETGTVLNNTVIPTAAPQSNTSNVQSFRESVRDRWFS